MSIFHALVSVPDIELFYPYNFNNCQTKCFCNLAIQIASIMMEKSGGFFYLRCLDFGVGHLVKVTKRSTFPWLLSNVYDNTTDRILAEGLTSHMVTWQGIKVGGIISTLTASIKNPASI